MTKLVIEPIGNHYRIVVKGTSDSTRLYLYKLWKKFVRLWKIDINKYMMKDMQMDINKDGTMAITMNQ